jgi:hypothetical protein
MKLQVKFTQEQLEECVKAIIKDKFKNENIIFDKVEFTTRETQFGRGPDITEVSVTIEI